MNNAKPILFSGPMVRALLDGRKTMTRWSIKPQPPTGYEFKKFVVEDHYLSARFENHVTPLGMWTKRLPHKSGDLLYVKETYAFVTCEPTVPGAFFGKEYGIYSDYGEWFRIAYAADDGVIDWEPPIWKPSIHMPRWASRLTLRITAVKVERVQEISETDAIAEGCKSHYCSPEDTASCPPGSDARKLAELFEGGFLTTKFDFDNLWNSIHGPGAWERNDWVAAYTFEVVKPNPAKSKTDGGRSHMRIFCIG